MTRQIRLIGALGILFLLTVHTVAQDTTPDSDAVTIRFVLTVPVDTPGGEPVYLSGDDAQLGNWDGEGLKLERQDGGVYSGDLTIRRGVHVQYKATRGSWQSVEKNEAGGEIENRNLFADKDKEVEVVVAAWSNGEAQRPEPTLTGDYGRHEEFHSTILDNDRTLLVYLPPGYDDNTDRRYPVLYMHDGQNIFDASTSFAGHEWEVDEAAERLIRSGKIEPIIIVGMYNNAERMTEYTPRPEDGKSDAYARFVVEEVKPFIDRTYRTDPSREKTGIAGSSLGGLISLYMVWAHAETFGRCGGVSPSLWWRDRWLIEKWGETDMSWASGARIWIDMGTLEGTLQGPGGVTSAVGNARVLSGLLKGAGQEGDEGGGGGHLYMEVHGGQHNEQAWAQRIEAILLFLYGSA